MSTSGGSSLRDRLLTSLERWIELAGYEVVRHDGYDELVSVQNGTLRVVGDATVSLANHDGSFLFHAFDDRLVFKYLRVELGPAFRVQQGLHPELIVRFGAPPRGWRVERSGERLHVLRDEMVVATLASSEGVEAAMVLCHVFDASETFLVASFRSPRGSRLFSPVDYHNREIPAGPFSHSQETCHGPRKWPVLALGTDANGWAECSRCLWCGKYWRTPTDNNPVPMTREQVEESLPWEPPGSFGLPIQ